MPTSSRIVRRGLTALLVLLGIVGLVSLVGSIVGRPQDDHPAQADFRQRASTLVEHLCSRGRGLLGKPRWYDHMVVLAITSSGKPEHVVSITTNPEGRLVVSVSRCYYDCLTALIAGTNDLSAMLEGPAASRVGSRVVPAFMLKPVVIAVVPDPGAN